MIREIPNVINTPLFLKFAEHFAKKFKEQNGFGRWIAEYQVMENKGLFKPTVVRAFYIKILQGQSRLDYIRNSAIYWIGISAQDAAETYYDNADSFLYKICVMTGEVAEDEDGDEYTELSYDEATQICRALNKDAEEELFIIKKM